MGEAKVSPFFYMDETEQWYATISLGIKEVRLLKDVCKYRFEDTCDPDEKLFCEQLMSSLFAMIMDYNLENEDK